MAKKKTKPLRIFTDEQLQNIEQMALDNCHVDTIAMALVIPKQTLVRRFGTFISQKRAEGRTALRRVQRKQAEASAAMAIFLGKNELGQTDRQDITTGGEKIEPIAVCPILSSKIAKGKNETDLEPKID